jgi:hypothetical protein
MTPTDSAPVVLSLRPREAARAIGVSERTLWTWSRQPGGPPFLRRGTAMLYPVDGLRAWLAAEAQAQAAQQQAPEVRP